MSQITKISVDGTVYDLPAGGSGGIAEIPDPLEVGVLKVGKNGGDVLTIDSSNIPTFAKIPEAKDAIVALDSTRATAGDVVKAVKKAYGAACHTVRFFTVVQEDDYNEFEAVDYASREVLDGEILPKEGFFEPRSGIESPRLYESSDTWFVNVCPYQGWYVVDEVPTEDTDLEKIVGDGNLFDFSSQVDDDLILVAISRPTSYSRHEVHIHDLDDLTAFQKSYAGEDLHLMRTDHPDHPDAGRLDCVYLESDIDMSGVKWDSVGLANGSTNNPSYAFTSVFDGRGHRITNLTFSDLSEGGTVGDVNNYRGFFGLVRDGVVKNLTVSGNGFGDDPPPGEYGCAMIVGRMTTAVTTDGNGKPNGDVAAAIENCVAEGAVTGTHNVAGVAVHVCAGTIRNCTNRATVVGKYKKVGGVLNFAQGQTGKSIEVNVIDCVNEGSVTATDNSTKGGQDGVGGIVGYVNYLTLTMDGCVNSGVVSRTATALQTAPVGQIVGKMENSATIGGRNRVLPLIPCVGVYTSNAYRVDAGGWPSGWNFGRAWSDADGLVTLVKDADVVQGGEYRVMTIPTSSFKLSLQDVPISFDERLCTVDVVSGIDGYSVTKTRDGVMTTYRVSQTQTDAMDSHQLAEEVGAGSGDSADLEQVAVSAGVEATDSTTVQTVVDSIK